MGLERWRHTVPLRLRSIFRSGRVERDLDEEIRDHLERQIEAEMKLGASADEARQKALRAFGGVEQRKEECRDARRLNYLEHFLQDLRLSVRTLRRSPGFTTAAMLTLTLGIGINVAMFTVVNGVLLQAMPFRQPDRLFLVSLDPIRPQRGPFRNPPAVADRDYLDYQRSTRMFERLASFTAQGADLNEPGEPTHLPASMVTPEFFSVLQVKASIGRTFALTELPATPEAIISDKLWRDRFNADPGAVGQSITLDGVRRTVIGVMPAGFDFPSKTDAWVPLEIRIESGISFSRPVIGRLVPGASAQQAQAELEAFARSREATPGSAGSRLSRVLPLKELLVRDVRTPLAIFSGAVAFVLLIACANIANLQLTRAVGRRHEMAVRMALGAGRGRLIRQLLTESAVLALAAGGLGLVLAGWLVPALVALAPREVIPRVEMIRIDMLVIGFVIGISLLTVVLSSLAPALHVTRRRHQDSLLPSGRSPIARPERLRAVLVVSEIALALVLLTGAGLLLKSFLRLRAVDPGFVSQNVAAMTVDLPESVYASAAQIQAFHERTLTRLAGIPGATAAGAVNWLPLGGPLLRGDFQVEGRSTPEGLLADKLCVSPGYFRAMGIRLLRGRDFAATDRTDAPGVAIVSRSLAQAIWSNDNPVGRRITMASHPRPDDWLTVVGVVDDVKQVGPASASHPGLYQVYWQVARTGFLRHMTFVVRTASDPRPIMPAMRAALHEVDKTLPPQAILPMTDFFEIWTAQPAFETRLLAVFASLALGLALVGIYGVLAYSVAQRTREIGIRMALGAATFEVVAMILRRTLVFVGVGVMLGFLTALGLTRVLRGFLFDIKPDDPATFIWVAMLVLGATMAAAWLPARRAARVNPTIALREE